MPSSQSTGVKICIVHNDYGKFSGEEAVVRDHVALFRAKGCDVVEFHRSSEELKGLCGKIKGFVCGIWNPFSVRRFAEFLDTEKPNIVHIHNLYPLINPAVLPEAKKRGIRVVMTVHNFRLFCPSGLFAVDNGICEECALEKSVRPCMRRNCLHSRFKTIGYALRHWRTVQYYMENVNCFLCLTPFQMRKLVQYGVPEEKCRILPNFIDDAWLEKTINAQAGSGDYVAYMGRLSEEKGIDIILDAARQLPHIQFRLAGNGEEAFREEAPSNVSFVGYVTGEAQFNFLRNARLHVMASRCYENFPTSLLQTMALGIPSVVPADGPMADIVGEAGIAFKSGKLAETLDALYGDSTGRQRCHEAALRHIQKFTAERYWELYSQLLQKTLA